MGSATWQPIMALRPVKNCLKTTLPIVVLPKRLKSLRMERNPKSRTSSSPSRKKRKTNLSKSSQVTSSTLMISSILNQILVPKVIRSLPSKWMYLHLTQSSRNSNLNKMILIRSALERTIINPHRLSSRFLRHLRPPSPQSKFSFLCNPRP